MRRITILPILVSAVTAARAGHTAPVIDWERVAHPGTTAAVESVVFPGRTAGWILQRDGTLLMSGDGGRTWAVRARIRPPVRRLAVAPAGGLVVAGDGVVWASTDGGRAWRESPVGGGGSLNALSMSPDGMLWAAGMAGEVHASADGGASWTPRGRPDLGHLFAIAAGPHGVVLAGGLRGLWESRDGGTRWSFVNLDRIPEVHAAPRPSITDLVPAGGGVWIAGRLDDFAMLWWAPWSHPTGATLVHHEEDYRYLRILPGPEGSFWAGGPAGFLARSADRGRRWSQEPPGIPGEIRALALDPDGALYAAGAAGAVFRGRDPAGGPPPAGGIPAASTPRAP